MIRWRTFIIGWGLALALILFAQRKPPIMDQRVFAAIIDLTHSINDTSPNWEGTEQSPFKADVKGTYEKDGYFSRHISVDEHYGTHIDAPAHFARGTWTVDQIPAERLVRPLVVLDVRAKAQRNPDYEITVEDVAAWEQINGEIPPGAIVLARTGWAEKWNAPKLFRNADEHGVPHYPGYSLETAKFLVQARSIVGLGTDTMSVDIGASKDYPVHRFCAMKSVYHLENVAELDHTPEVGAILVVSPAKLQGGSGGPVRLFALVK